MNTWLVTCNQNWGMFSNPNNQGEFIFYTIGVYNIRIWNGSFSLGNSVKKFTTKQSGFDDVDNLWSSLQNGMIQCH